MSTPNSDLALRNNAPNAESLAAAGDLLGAELVQDIEVNRACLARLESPDAIPQIDQTYESFVPGADFDELVTVSNGFVRENNVLAIPRQRGKRPTPKHVDTNIRGRLVAVCRDAGPGLVLLFETGMEKCRQDLTAASAQISETSADVSQLPTSTPLTEVAADQRTLYVDDLIRLAGQSSRAGTLLPYRNSLVDLDAVLESEINALLNAVAGAGQLPTRLMRQFATEIGRLERAMPILKVSGKNIVAKTVNQIYAQRPDLQQNSRSPEELAKAHDELMELKTQTEQQRLVGDRCYKTLVGLRDEWRGQLTAMLSEQISVGVAQISAGEELIAEIPSGPERAELEAQLAHAKAYIELVCTELGINDYGAGVSSDLPEETVNEIAAFDSAENPDLPAAANAMAEEAEATTPQAVHPALAYALRTARQIFKGGVKLTADRTLNDTAKQLHSLSIETKRGEKKRVLEPHECGMVMAVLADHDRCFLDLQHRVSTLPKGQLAPDMIAAKREWAPEIAMLINFDVRQTVARIHEVLSDTQLRQKLMGVLSQQEIEKLRKFVSPPQEEQARTVGSMAMSSAGQQALVYHV